VGVIATIAAARRVALGVLRPQVPAGLVAILAFFIKEPAARQYEKTTCSVK